MNKQDWEREEAEWEQEELDCLELEDQLMYLIVEGNPDDGAMCHAGNWERSY